MRTTPQDDIPPDAYAEGYFEYQIRSSLRYAVEKYGEGAAMEMLREEIEESNRMRRARN